MNTMNSPAQQVKSLTFRMLGEKGSNPTPIIDKLWEFYAQKGVKTVFISLAKIFFIAVVIAGFLFIFQNSAGESMKPPITSKKTA